jgi:trimethylamine-N-oxide reductase (cytochrome c)
LENAEVLICTGWDPETSAMGDFGFSSSIFARWYKENGIKLIAISPDCNYSNAIYADKWIPILPNTDAALYLAIAYVWIIEGTYDKGFVETHCYGFEAFKNYVVGNEDGVPKTPEWAEKITKVPARTIKALARTWANKRTSIMFMSGGPKIRGPYSHEPARLEALLMAMQGLGKPGRQFAYCCPIAFRSPFHTVPTYPEVVVMGFPNNEVVEYGNCPPPPKAIPLIKTLVPEAILKPPVSWTGLGAIIAPLKTQFSGYTFPPEGHPGIRMIWNENNCYTTCWKGNIIDAFRDPKVEFIVAIHPWLENDAFFADLVLPATTLFEVEDIGCCSASDMKALVFIDKCFEPVGESKSDYEIHRIIAERLAKEFNKPELLETFPPPEEWLRKAYGKTLAAQRGVSWEEFKKRKIIVYDAPTPEEFAQILEEYGVKPGMNWYYELPEGTGLETPTGKIEFYSKSLAENLPEDVERPPVPHWIPYSETHQESLLHPRSKKYPLVVNSPHPKWRHHAMGDAIPWFRELSTCKIKGPDGYLYEPVWIHPEDAAKRGIRNGDIVKVYNERGTMLGAAYITERTIPGSIRIDHGARLDLISIEERIDRGGAVNMIAPEKLTSRHASGMVCSGFLVEVEKVELAEIKRKYAEVFKQVKE